MPIEGIEPQATPTATTASAASPATPATTSDATAQNTDAAGQGSGTGTQAAQKPTEAQTEKTFTQADVDRIVQNRLKSAVKAELKKLTGEGEGTATVEELQRQLSEAKTKTQTFEAREAVRDYMSDPENKLNVKPENMRAVEKLVMPDIEFDDSGKPSNLKEVFKAAKSLAPALFANPPASINAGQGRNSTAPTDMNAFIRRQAGVG